MASASGFSVIFFAATLLSFCRNLSDQHSCDLSAAPLLHPVRFCFILDGCGQPVSHLAI